MDFDRTSNINSDVSIKQELSFLFKTTDSIIIFDIGACEGESSIQYSRLFPNSRIYTFEPLPANIELIRDNFTKYKVNNASYFNKALSSKNGIAEFYVPSGKPENAIESDWDYGNKSSSLLPPEKHLEKINFIHFEKKIEVDTVTLKSFCNSNKIKKIDFIHMDVQGAELMVLEGAEDFVSSIKSIWLEVSKVPFYKDQPLVDDVKRFMLLNNFVLIKDSLNGDQGDQLYVSKKFFPKYKLSILRNRIMAKRIIAIFLRRIKLMK